MKVAIRLFQVCFMGLVVGFSGAAFFNPDDGTVKAKALWRVFGLYAYVGLFLTIPMALAVGVLWLFERRRTASPMR